MRLSVVRVGAALFASGALSCTLVMGFDGYDTSSDIQFDTLRGVVDGLDPDAGVTVSVNGKSVVVPNGTFEIEHAVVPDHPFSVAAQSPVHDCVPDPANGLAGRDGADVAVHCRSRNASLTSLSFAAGALEPPFDPAHLDYVLRAPLGAYVAGMSGTAIAQSPGARIAVGPDFIDGPPDAAAPITFPTPHVLALRVTSAAGPHVSYGVRGAVSVDELRARDAGPFAGFGYSVAISGDTLVIGAPQESSGSGAVHVFHRSGATWSEEATLVAGPGAAQNFGAAIAVSGDVIVVGTPVSGDGPGIYVFGRTGTTWTPEAAFAPADLGVADGVGSAVAVLNDVIAVGVRTLPHGDVIILRRNGSQWKKEAALSSPRVGTNDDRFGHSVALLPGRVVVGEYDATNSSGISQGGAAYVYGNRTGSWALETTLSGMTGAPVHDQFGLAVAAVDDAIAVAAPEDQWMPTDAGASRMGRVYVFRLAQGTWAREAVLFPPPGTGSPADTYGSVVAFARDVLVVGDQGVLTPTTGLDSLEPDPSSPLSAGALDIFVRGDTAWSRRAFVARPPSSRGFASSVATDGRTFIAGAPNTLAASDAGPSTDLGVVYVY